MAHRPRGPSKTSRSAAGDLEENSSMPWVSSSMSLPNERPPGTLGEKVVRAILNASDEVMQGDGMSILPLDVFQTGSGTSTNMNANEVSRQPFHVEILGEPLGVYRRPSQ